MKLNPFAVNYFNKLFIFQEKNESMILKIYTFVEFLKLKESFKIIQERLKDYKDINICIQIHFEHPRKTYSLSLNCKLDGLFLKMHDFEEKFQEIDRELVNSYIDVNEPYKNVYLTLFSGIDAFLMKLENNQVVLLDPMSKKNLLNIVLYRVKLSNLEMVTNFFNFFTDLTQKMKLRFEIYFFIKKENDKMLIQSNLAFIEKNQYRFQEMLEKFYNLKELRVMLDALPVNKKKITELFLRRLIDEKFDFKIDENLDFLSKYLLDQQAVLEQPRENGNTATDENEPVIPAATLLVESPIAGEIEDSARNVFQESLQGLNVQGTYLDSQECVFDDGNSIYFLISELNVKALLDLFKSNVMNRKFKLIFIDPDELAEFTQVLVPNYGELLEAITLEEFSLSSQAQAFSS